MDLTDRNSHPSNETWDAIKTQYHSIIKNEG